MRMIDLPPATPGMRSRMGELYGLINELASVDWRHPLWWAIVGGAAAALGRAGRPADYLASDAEPRADTFMGWPEPATDASGRIADAVLSAHAAAAALDELDGVFPDQPLRRAVVRDNGSAVLATIDPRRVAFVVGDRAFLARLAATPAGDHELAAALARIAAGGCDPRLDPVDPRGAGVPAAIAVVLGDDDLAVARHLHRRAWSRGGGPWLGLGRAGELAVVSTCHMVVDGYGHACLTSRVARHRDHTARAALAAAARSAGARTLPPLSRVAGAESLGVAWRRVGALPRFPTLGHALGRVLHADEGDARATYSPTFQVPVAPGHRDDPQRRLRRIVPTLLSVRFSDGEAEPESDFAARAAAAVIREAAGAGLMSRLIEAARAAPAPLAWKRRVVGSASRPLLLAPATRVLGGRACLSLLRLGDEAGPAPPLVAVSSPGLLPSILDPIGSTVLTIVVDDTGTTITASGAGRTGDAAEAGAFIDRWLAVVACSERRAEASSRDAEALRQRL